MKQESLPNRTVQRASGSAIVAVPVMSAISYRRMAASGTGDGLMRHSQEVINNHQDRLLELQGAESSQRGLVLASDENSL
jgi:CHASE3 domain sensor protein